MEAESADMQNMQGLSQMKCGSASNLSNTDMENHGECTKLDQESVLPESENGGLSYYFVWLSSFFLRFFLFFFSHVVRINNGEI